MNTSPLGKLTQGDFIRGAVTAILAGLVLAVGTVIHGTIIAPGFDIFSVDWTSLFHTAIDAAIIGAEGGFVGYIGKNLMTDENGNIPALGSIGKTK